MKKISLNTNLLPILNVDTYWSNTFVQDYDISLEETDALIQDIAPKYLKELICSCIPSAEVYVTGVYHPSQYNYGGDELDFDVAVDDKVYEDFKQSVINDELFDGFLHTSYKSSDGYINNMPESIEEFNEAQEDYQLAQMLMFKIPADNIVANQEQYDVELYDAVTSQYSLSDEYIEEDNLEEAKPVISQGEDSLDTTELIQVYQMRSGEGKHGFIFQSLDFQDDNSLARDNYDNVANIHMDVPGGEDVNNTLDDVFAYGNSDDFHDKYTARSISVSDIIKYRDRYYFVDSFGFEDITDRLGDDWSKMTEDCTQAADVNGGKVSIFGEKEKKLNEDAHEDYIEMEKGLAKDYKDRLIQNITPEIRNAFNDLKDILTNEDKDTEVGGFYFPNKAVEIVKMANGDGQYHLNVNMDLNVSDILNMVDDNETIESAIDELFDDYKADSALSWGDNFINILSKMDFDVHEDADREEIIREIKAVIDGLPYIDDDDAFNLKDNITDDIIDTIVDTVIEDNIDIYMPDFDEKVVDIITNYIENNLNESKEVKTESLLGDTLEDMNKFIEKNNLDPEKYKASIFKIRMKDVPPQEIAGIVTTYNGKEYGFRYLAGLDMWTVTLISAGADVSLHTYDTLGDAIDDLSNIDEAVAKESSEVDKMTNQFSNLKKIIDDVYNAKDVESLKAVITNIDGLSNKSKTDIIDRIENNLQGNYDANDFDDVQSMVVNKLQKSELFTESKNSINSKEDWADKQVKTEASKNIETKKVKIGSHDVEIEVEDGNHIRKIWWNYDNNNSSTGFNYDEDQDKFVAFEGENFLRPRQSKQLLDIIHKIISNKGTKKEEVKPINFEFSKYKGIIEPNGDVTYNIGTSKNNMGHKFHYDEIDDTPFPHTNDQIVKMYLKNNVLKNESFKDWGVKPENDLYEKMIGEIAKALDIPQNEVQKEADAIKFRYNDKVYFAEPISQSQIDVFDDNHEKIGWGVIPEKLKGEVFTEYTDSDYIYELVGGEYAGEYTRAEAEKLPIKEPELTDDLSDVRAEGGFVHRKELDNQLQFKGYLGPMWNGIHDDGPHIRYETQEVYDMLSESKTKTNISTIATDDIESADTFNELLDILDKSDMEDLTKLQKARSLVAHAFTHVSDAEEVDILDNIKGQVIEILTEAKSNDLDKVTRLKLMDRAARSINDEDIFELWLMAGVPDGATEEDFEDIAKDDKAFSEIEEEFKKVMKLALDDGLYDCDEEAYEFAKQYEPQLVNESKSCKTESKFKDKVKAIKKSLKDKDGRLSDETAEEQAKKIAGSMIKNERVFLDSNKANLNEAEESNTGMTFGEFKAKAKEIYNNVFPNSACTINLGALGKDTFFITWYLAGSQEEFPNGISQNDLFHVFFYIDDAEKHNKYNVERTKLTDDTILPSMLVMEVPNGASIFTKPDNQYMAYGSVSLPFRKTTGSPEKILATLDKYANKLHDKTVELLDNDMIPDNRVELVKAKL